jgi:hypothetical protein
VNSASLELEAFFTEAQQRADGLTLCNGDLSVASKCGYDHEWWIDTDLDGFSHDIFTK